MTNRGQWIAVGAVFLAICGVLGAGLALSGDLAPVSIGSRAPAFRVTDLATGDTVALADYSGEVVLLNVWATWCGPCEQEMPSMERLHRELGPEGLKVVAVSIDDSDANGVRRWVADRNGVIVKKVIGATEWDHPTQKALFRRLLADRSTRGAGG